MLFNLFTFVYHYFVLCQYVIRRDFYLIKDFVFRLLLFLFQICDIRKDDLKLELTFLDSLIVSMT